LRLPDLSHERWRIERGIAERGEGGASGRGRELPRILGRALAFDGHRRLLPNRWCSRPAMRRVRRTRTKIVPGEANLPGNESGPRQPGDRLGFLAVPSLWGSPDTPRAQAVALPTRTRRYSELPYGSSPLGSLLR